MALDSFLRGREGFGGNTCVEHPLVMWDFIDVQQKCYLIYESERGYLRGICGWVVLVVLHGQDTLVACGYFGPWYP